MIHVEKMVPTQVELFYLLTIFLTLKFCLIPLCSGCRFAEQADGMIAKQDPLATWGSMLRLVYSANCADFRRFFANIGRKKWRFFLITNAMIQFSHKLAAF
jgi:hypothetical protein